MAAHIPGAHGQRANQSAGKNSSGLQRVKAENLAPVMGVAAPIVDHIQNLCADNARQHHEDAEIPRVIAIDTLLFRNCGR